MFFLPQRHPRTFFLPQRHPRTSFLRNSKIFTESHGICVFLQKNPKIFTEFHRICVFFFFFFFFFFVFFFFLFFLFFFFFWSVCLLFFSSILRFSNLFDKEVFKNEVCLVISLFGVEVFLWLVMRKYGVN